MAMSDNAGVHRGGVRPYIWFFCITLFVFVLEVVGGKMSGSLALIADAVHSPTHIVAGALAIWAWRRGLRAGIEESLGRHKRVRKIIACLIALGALKIGWDAVLKLWSGGGEVFGWWALLVAVIGLIANAFQYNIIKHCDCEPDQALLVDIKSDFQMSVAIIASSLLIGLGAWSWLDSVLSLVAVIFFIAPNSWQLFFGGEHHH